MLANPVLDEITRLKHVEAALRRDLPTVVYRPAHPRKALIAAGGPSLTKELKRLKRAKGDIFSMNGTHDYLISKKITPDYFVMTDPRQENVRFVQKPKKGVKYLIAAHCHPDVFDALSNQDASVWYPHDYPILHNSVFTIGGGSTVGLRALNIAYILGYRDIHLFGFDGCIKDHHHAYPQPENDDDKTHLVKYDNVEYRMADWMVVQAENFDQYLQSYGTDFKLTVHSDGIVKHIGDNYASSSARRSA